jgi:hypothetical protein
MTVQIDEVLWEFSKSYRKMFQAKHPDVKLSAGVAAIATVRAMETTGHAVQNIGPDGNVTWTATKKFLDETGLEAGPLVTVRSTLS